jgi:hypothetical protein
MPRPHVRGSVVDAETHSPVEGLDVALTLVRGRRRTVLARTASSASGEFHFDIRRVVRAARVGGSGAFELSVSSKSGTAAIDGGKWRWPASADPGDVKLCVKVDTTCAPVVSETPGGLDGDIVGLVRHRDGTPVPGVVVTVHDVQVSGESAALDTTTTSTSDPKGWYALTPSATGPLQRNLVVRVVTSGGTPRFLGSSPIFWRDTAPGRVDIEISHADFRAPSEWARYAPNLDDERDGEDYADLGIPQQIFLSQRTGIALPRVAWWVTAFLLADRVGLTDPDAPEALYGLQYGGLPTDPRELMVAGAARIGAVLLTAYEDNIIGKDASLLGEGILDALTTWREGILSDDANPESIYALFDAGTLSTGAVEDIVAIYVAHAGTSAAFWEAVAVAHSSDIPEAKRLVKLGSIAFGHAPTVVAINAEISNGAASLTASLTAGQWTTIVAAISGGEFPTGIPGADLTAQRANYAVMLKANAEAAFPGAAVNAKVLADTSLGDANTFASNNPSFDFDRDDVLARSGSALVWGATDAERNAAARFQRIARFVPSTGGAATAALLYNGGIDSAASLTHRGPTRALAQLTAAPFSLSPSDARIVIEKAARVAAKATTLYTRAHANLLGVHLTGGTWPDRHGYLARFLPASTVDTSAVGSWGDLFGDADYCTCKDCRSITGPAAYLVDLLHWLDERDGWTGALADRRPDLGTVALSCANSTRVLPYIDLALEVLEDRAASLLSVTGLAHDTTDVDGPELLASPQYVNHPVYEALASEKWPITLPFNRPAAEARVFLTHLGVRRTELMRAVSNTGSPTTTDILVEEIGLDSGLAGAITSTGGNEYDRWGVAMGDWPDEVRDVETLLDRTELSYEDLLDLLHTRFLNARAAPTATKATTLAYTDACDLATYTLNSSDTWDDVFTRIRQVVRLRRATGWSFLELDRALTALGATSITSEVLAKVGAIHQLVREARCSVAEVAALYAPIDNWSDRDTRESPTPTPYETTFLNPAVFAFADRANASTTAHAFVLDSAGEPNGASAPFTDYAAEIQGLLGVDATSFAVLSDLLGSGALLSRANLSTTYRRATLARATGLTIRQLGIVAGLWGADAFAAPAATLQFVEEVRELLSSGLNVDDLEYLVLHDADAEARIGPTTRWYQGVVGRVVDAVAAHFGDTPTPTADADGSTLAALLDELDLSTEDRTQLEDAIAGTLEATADPYDDYLRSIFEEHLAGWCNLDRWSIELAQLTVPLPTDDVEIAARRLFAAQRLVRGRDARKLLSRPTADADQSQLTALLDACLPTGATDLIHPVIPEVVVDRGTLDAAIAGTLDDAGQPGGVARYSTWLRLIFETVFEGLLDVDDAAARLAGLSGPTTDAAETAARQLWVLQRLTQWSTAQGTVVSEVATALGRTEAEWTALRATPLSVLDSGMDTPTGAFADWTNAWLHADVRASGLGLSSASTITDANAGIPLTLARVFWKLVRAATQVGLDTDTFTWWIGAASAWSLWVPESVTASAPASPEGATAWYAALKRLSDLARIPARLPGSSPTFPELLATLDDWDAPALTGFSEALAERTGWDVDDIADTADAIDFLGVSHPRARTEVFHQLLDALALVRRTGSDADTVLGWGAGITMLEAGEITLAARSRYKTPEAWAAVARPLRDQLRKAQRDALVAYLLTRSGTTTTDDLYGDLLIDTQMNPEMLTSRIKQATASVQTYIQRNMLGIDTEVTFNDDDRSEWEWKKSYRVWEAARKVFLYPENWIEPELRDDKSPFFEALEAELSQGDVTDERAEDATLTYLDSLHEVARPEVLTYFRQREVIRNGGEAEETIDVLHVLARARGAVPSYWYRRWEEQQTWSPWEKVECGVKGTFLALRVYQRRLLLLWLTIEETGNPTEGADPASWYEIRLAWSEYRDGRWQPKNEAEESLSLETAWAGSSATESGTRPASDYEPSLFSLLTDEADGTLTVTVMCWNRVLFKWYKVGTFTMNACTRAIRAVAMENTDENWVSEEIQEAAETCYNSSGVFISCPRPSPPVSWDDLSDEDRQAVYDWMAVSWPDVYAATGAGFPEEVQVIARVDGTFAQPAYLNDTYEEADVQHLSIFKSTWDDDSQEGDDEGKRVVHLLGTVGDSSAVLPTQVYRYVSQMPFFVSEGGRSWMVVKESPTVGQGKEADVEAMIETAERALARAATGEDTAALVSRSYSEGGPYRFDNFFHPYVCAFIEEVRRIGIGGLYAPDEQGAVADLSRQQRNDEAADRFHAAYTPTVWVKTPYPFDEIDFSATGAYSQYNWELFFHVPFYVANRLQGAQRFEDAMRWYSFIFDPLNRGTAGGWTSAPERFWKVKPFLEPVTADVQDWLTFTGADGDDDAANAFEREVEAWLDDPFNPHLLARLRNGTYQKATVMRYLDNLVAWGDHLFTRDTIESINEATQLYILASQILGDRPVALTRPTAPDTASFEDLRGLDAFSNGRVQRPDVWLEALIRPGRWSPLAATPSGTLRLRRQEPTPAVARDFYFCIPPNPKLLGYWDTLADRLFKIRNSLNIDGVFRTLPLYEAPIDPALLVRASAEGVDLGTVLADLNPALPNHRFVVLVGRAQALAGSVKALGGALLQALEKRDAEALALLRQTQELRLLGMVRTSKERAIDESREALAALQRSRATVAARRAWYAKLRGKGWLPEENAAAVLTQVAIGLNLVASTFGFIGGVGGIAPQVIIGTLMGTEAGGQNVHQVATGFQAAFNGLSAFASGEAGYLSTVAAYKRRAEDWSFQESQAEKELLGLDRQIAGAKIRVEIAQNDLDTHDEQVAQSEAVQAWMQSKFTNRELYDWMVTRISTTYYQTYQLAYQVAKRAQRAYNYELGRSDSYVSAGNWDNTRKGLLAGEQLAFDLERLDAAYADNDRREHEMTKHISLAQLDPLALARLQVDGECYFVLPEVLFDLDNPAHYFRRIQSVAVSLAAVTGQNATINAQLTLHGSSVRRTTSDALEVEDSAGYPSIVTSSAANDSGLFQTDLRDPRYLPFERWGAVSQWHLKLTAQEPGWKQFDWTTLTDATIHMRYTARDGGAQYGDSRVIDVGEIGLGYSDPSTAQVTPAGRVFVMSAKRDNPDEFYSAQQDGGADELDFEITAAMLGTAPTTFSRVAVVPVSASSTALTAVQIGTSLDPAVTLDEVEPAEASNFGFHWAEASGDAIGTHTVTLTGATYADLTDLILILVLS